MPNNLKTDWLAESRGANRLLFSELNVLLKALDRFFAADLLSADEVLAARNFRGELRASRDVIMRVIGILEAVMPETRKNAYWFQKFTESKLLDGRRKQSLNIEIYKQDTPEKSLYVLYDSFINLKSIATDLLRNDNITYMSFTNVGAIVSKQIRENAYFNPFEKDINPEFDTVDNQTVSDIVRNIKEKNFRKAVSVVFLFLFRFMRYLAHVDVSTSRFVTLHSSLLVISLLKSEIDAFRAYVSDAIAREKQSDITMLLQGVSYQFAMETKRVYMQEMKDIMDKAPQQMKGRIENSHGILKNLTEQSIIQIAQFWQPEINGEVIFDSFLTRLEQSLKLREDIFLLDLILGNVEKAGTDPKAMVMRLDGLRDYIKLFEDFTFRFLRHDDYEEFDAFFKLIHKIKPEKINTKVAGKIVEKCGHFRVFMQTTLRQISNRTELLDQPLDVEKARETASQYEGR